MALFWTADHHFGHKNIISHANRPFASVHEMNSTMVSRWNSVVQPGDTVYHLGDMFWGNPTGMMAIFERLNGNIHLIQGNHDQLSKKPAFRDRFTSIQPFLELGVGDLEAPRGKRLIVMCHYALRTWNMKHWGSWSLYGHSHGALPDDPNALALDVGVDCWDFTPASYEQIKERMALKTWTPPHGRRHNETA